MADGMSDWLPDRNLALKEYFVAVVDILGQSERLKSVRLPQGGADEEALVPVIKDTYGLVHLFRTTFNKTFVAMAERKRLRPFEVVHYGVADAMFIGIPLDREGQAAGVHAAMFALAGIFLMFTSRGHFLRGATDVGVASDVFPGELYGPATAAAYRLEKEVADYPRVVIGEGLLSLLQRWEASPAQDVEARTAQAVAVSCSEMIAVDLDGWPILDYLGGAYRRANSEPGDMAVDSLAALAHDKTRSELRRLRAAGDRGQVSRCTRLLHYLESRGAASTPSA